MKSKKPNPIYEKDRYNRWVRYLKDSKLNEQQIHERATRLTEQGRDPDF
jgi:hypothetical protein